MARKPAPKKVVKRPAKETDQGARAARAKGSDRKRPRTWKPVSDPLEPGGPPLFVQLPSAASPEALHEAAHQVETMERHGQIDRGEGPLAPGATHRTETQPDGTKRLVRQRYSAI